MPDIESLVVIGSSGSGKTTLVNGLRDERFETRVVIPERRITRPKRAGDDLVENDHTTQIDFKEGIGSIIDPYWSRELEPERIEQYGFVPPDKNDPRLRIYSANNAFMRDRNPSVERVLLRGLVVVVTAERDTRKQRLADRSPDLSDAERAIRLDDDGGDIILPPGLLIGSIDTTHLSPAEGQKAFQDIVSLVLEY